MTRPKILVTRAVFPDTIERLGARKDGVIRGHALRRDGTVRDTVMYSMRAGEWPEARAQLLYLRARHA